MSEAPHPRAGQEERATALAQAVDLQRAGRLVEAAEIYHRLLANCPDDFDATQLLGAIALQQERFFDAQRLLRSALDMNPRDTAVMANLGTSHMRVGDYEAALGLFESAVELQPESSIWHANLGTVLHNMRRYPDAIPPLRRAHQVEPASYAICTLLGVCLARIGENAEAASLFETATRVDPGNPEAWEQHAIALNALGLHQQAVESAAKAEALNPRSPVALAAMGHAHYEQGSFSEAADRYREAIAIAQPSPDLYAAYGNALVSCALYDEAIEQFKLALELDGSRLDVRWAMTMAHLRPVYDSQSDSEASRGAFTSALADVEAWCRQGHDIREPLGVVGTLQPFYIAYQSVNNRELLGRYGVLCASWMATHAVPGRSGTATRSRGGTRLRIGVVSSHIHQHSVWTAITRGWVYNIDTDGFEIHLFKLDAWSDHETDRAKAVAAHFDDRPKHLDGWIQSVLDQDLDVIIYPEIGMHALTLQLAALRLAPVQAAAWGHPETTGLPTIDLYLSADGFEPADAAANYVEELVRLPNLGVYVEPLSPEVSDARLRSLKLSGGDTLLLCPGAPFKYAPMYDAVWVQIASRLRRKSFRWRGGGRLVFFRSRSAVMDGFFERRLRAVFKSGGVDFDGHVTIVPALERSRFFGLMQQSALMLDTVGFSGFNTALQAIECALPVLAFEGRFMRGRLASAIMQRLEIPELVATNTDEFVEKAVALAGDAGLLKKLRARIIERRDLLFYDKAPVRALEQRLTEAVAKARAHDEVSRRQT